MATQTDNLKSELTHLLDEAKRTEKPFDHEDSETFLARRCAQAETIRNARKALESA